MVDADIRDLMDLRQCQDVIQRLGQETTWVPGARLTRGVSRIMGADEADGGISCKNLCGAPSPRPPLPGFPGPGRRGEVVIDSGSKKFFPKFALRKMDILPR